MAGGKDVNPKAALIIEGGGMRGAFSSGVLNAMLDANLRFPYVIGMSSGACCGLFYLSEEQDNAREFFPRIARSGQEAFGLRSWLKGNGLFNLTYIVDHMASLKQIDYGAVLRNPTRFIIGATQADNAELVYWEKDQIKDHRTLQQYVKASASLPVIAPPVRIKGRDYVDGGVIDSIPIKKALEDGYEKIVVVHTQPRDYRKTRQRLELISMAWLRRYPQLRVAIETRHLRYNTTLKKMFQMEDDGNLFVIAPERTDVGRYGLDEASLENYYRQGYAILWEKQEALKQFLT